MINQTIARRYAQALMALGQEEGSLSQYGEELAAVTKVLATPELMEVLSNPIYPEETRSGIISQVLTKMKLSKMVENFISLLQDKGRIGYVESINDYFQHLVDEANNVKRATITTAVEVGDQVTAQIKATLEEMTGKSVILQVKNDPDIIGGVIAQVGDLTLDGSVKTQLKNLKESLIKG